MVLVIFDTNNRIRNITNGKREINITFDSNNRLVHIQKKKRTLFFDKHWIEKVTV